VEIYSTATAATALYTYDLLDQLLVSNDPAVGLFTYSYDRAFNRKTQASPDGLTTYSYDAANQMAWYLDRTGYTTYSYDLNGNTSTVVAPEGATTHLWDPGDHLIGMQLPASASQRAFRLTLLQVPVLCYNRPGGTMEWTIWRISSGRICIDVSLREIP
jgi:YD repeat-containing protein